MKVLSENPTNWLVLTDDGSTTTKTKSSSLNQLLFNHDLHGLLEEGSETWSSGGEQAFPAIHIIPDDDAECYTLKIMASEYEDLYLGSHQKSRMIEALESYYDNDRDLGEIFRMYEDIRGSMIRPNILKAFESLPRVERRDDGWFINGHLLLSWECEFFHPNTTSRQRSGGTVTPRGSDKAYSVGLDKPGEDIKRAVTIDGTTHRLTDKEVDFLARAIWALENTPDRT